MKTPLAVFLVLVALAGLCFWLAQPDDAIVSTDTVSMLSKRARSASDVSSGNDVEKQGRAVETESQAASSLAVDGPSLNVDKQKAIWELEHYTFELEWKFGQLIKDGIKEGSSDQLAACFRDDFVGSTLAPGNIEFVSGTSWQQQSTRSQESAEKPKADGPGLADFLVAEFSKLDELQSVGLRVLQIHRVDQTPDHYHLDVLLTAKGTLRGGPGSVTSRHRLQVVFANDEEIIGGKIVQRWDVDFIGIQDSRKPLFAEITDQVGLGELDLPDNWKLEPLSRVNTYTSQVAVADFDLDGYLDIAIGTIQGHQRLLRNIDGVEFRDVTEEVGLMKSRFGSRVTFANWIDYDNDNYPDLLIGKNLYHNDKGKSFSRATSKSKLKLESATLGAVVADYDCDGWLDLYVMNDVGEVGPGHKLSFVGDDSTSGLPNQLWRNLGDGTFQDVTDDARVGGGHRQSYTATWFYANEDHFPDLYVVNDFGRNLLFINRGDGTFDEISETARVGDYANSMGIASGDLDNNGTTELYVANMFSKMGRRIIAHVGDDDFDSGILNGIQGACAGSHLYTLNSKANAGDPTEIVYDEIGEQKNVNAIGWAYAPVFADFDADGLLDIYATCGFISVNRRKPDG
ncbi:MAG: VCBS repeat-containing protein [Pirellulaceae bacterium]